MRNRAHHGEAGLTNPTGEAKNGVLRLESTAASSAVSRLRTLAIPEAIAEWSLTTLREKLIKIRAKVVSHGRYVAFQMAELAIPRKLFAAIVERITALRSPPLAMAT
jgi:hypothetical protein